MAPSISYLAALWVRGGRNTKTGDVPALHIGRTRAESKASCEGCPLLDNGNCYAQYGTPAIAHSAMVKAHARGKDYSLKAALAGSRRAAKMVRLGAIGDPGALSLRYLSKAIKMIRSEGMDAVGYTHHWRERPDLAGMLMASCDTIAQADEALAMGYRAAVVLPADHVGSFTTPNGAKGIVCPAIKAPGKVTCNTCRLCDGSKRGPVIGFPDHGPKSRKRTTTNTSN